MPSAALHFSEPVSSLPSTLSSFSNSFLFRSYSFLRRIVFGEIVVFDEVTKRQFWINRRVVLQKAMAESEESSVRGCVMDAGVLRKVEEVFFGRIQGRLSPVPMRDLRALIEQVLRDEEFHEIIQRGKWLKRNQIPVISKKDLHGPLAKELLIPSTAFDRNIYMGSKRQRPQPLTPVIAEERLQSLAPLPFSSAVPKGTEGRCCAVDEPDPNEPLSRDLQVHFLSGFFKRLKEEADRLGEEMRPGDDYSILTEFTVRGDCREPREIFGVGFIPRCHYGRGGEEIKEIYHDLNDSDGYQAKRKVRDHSGYSNVDRSTFVSTSRSPGIASCFSEHGYMYLVLAQNGVYCSTQDEVMVPGGITAEYVLAAYCEDKGKMYLNPGAIPMEAELRDALLKRFFLRRYAQRA